MFSVGQPAEEYNALSGEALKDRLLADLDEVFSNQASPSYVKHITQNWAAEPFARAAYVSDQENWRNLRTLGESVANKVYFAGDAYTTGEDWSSVHAAARSAKAAVEALV